MAEAKKTTKKVAKEAELVVETAVTETKKAAKPKKTVTKVKQDEANLTAETEKETTLEAVEEANDGNSEEDHNDASQDDDAQVAVAKAGKRSAKALAAAEEKEAKEERKASSDDEEPKPKGPVAKTRSRLERRAKGFRKSAEALEVGKAYNLEEAVALAKKTSHVKFDATVEMHINLNVDPRHADQNIRDNLVLPAGSGKNVRVAVLTDDAASATAAGADVAGNEELLKELDKGAMNFDILIATPALMSKLGKYARVLGPRGLMPNPKSGTVTNDVNKAVAEAKAGRVEYRVDTTGIVHLGVGKVSFTEVQLSENVAAVLASIKANKPASVKSGYFKAIHLTTTMGPSINVDLASVN